MRAPSYTSLDEALEILAPYGIALSNGNSNHAPMVAEALCAMDRPDAVSAWIARYRERMLPRPEIRTASARAVGIFAPFIAQSTRTRQRAGDY